MSSRLACNVANAINRRGALITLRRVSGDPPNPPTVASLVLADNAAEGQDWFNLTSDVCDGTIVVGDMFTVANQTLTVTGQSTIVNDAAIGFTAGPIVSQPSPPLFSGVTFTPALAATVAAATAVTPTWSADLRIKAMVDSYSAYLVDGDLILAKDLRIRIAAFMNPVPLEGQLLVVNGDVRTIKSVTPGFVRGEVVEYVIQAR